MSEWYSAGESFHENKISKAKNFKMNKNRKMNADFSTMARFSQSFGDH